MTPIAGRLSDMYEDLSKKELPVNQANQFHHSTNRSNQYTSVACLLDRLTPKTIT